MIPTTSDCSASYTPSVSPIRCVTEHCGLSVNYHKDKKVNSNVSHMLICILYNILYVYLSYLFSDYRIVIICSSEEEGKSHVISKLQLFRRRFSALQPNTSFASYLLRHFKRWPKALYQKGLSRTVVASSVDPDE